MSKNLLHFHNAEKLLGMLHTDIYYIFIFIQWVCVYVYVWKLHKDPKLTLHIHYSDCKRDTFESSVRKGNEEGW